MEEKKLLQVGDRIVASSYGAIVSVCVIDRVTATQAFAKTTKFKREYSPNWVRLIGGSIYNSNSYQIETPELIKKATRQMNINKLKTALFSNLTDEQLEKMVEILTPKA